MTHIEVMKQALEYLRDNQHHIADNERHTYVMEYNAFIEKLEQAIAEESSATQEPVAYVTGVYAGRFTYAPIKASVVLPVGMAFYTHPQPKAEQVKWSDYESDGRIIKSYPEKDKTWNANQ